MPGKDRGVQPWLYIQIESTLLYQMVPEDVRRPGLDPGLYRNLLVKIARIIQRFGGEVGEEVKYVSGLSGGMRLRGRWNKYVSLYS